MNNGILTQQYQSIFNIYDLLGYPSPILLPDQYGNPDAIDWLRRVRRAGGNVSKATFDAVLSFCDSINAAKIRDKFLRLSLFCGSSLTSALVPLYIGRNIYQSVGNSTDTNINFVSGDYIESRGLKGNGSNKYLNTGLNISAYPTNCHLSYAGTSLETSGDSIALGTFGSVGTNNDLCIADVYSAYVTGRPGRIGSPTPANVPNNTVSPLPTFELHYCVSRISSNSLTLYTAGRVTSRSIVSIVPSLYSGSHYIFCLNTTTTPNAYTAANLQMYSIGLGLTDSEVSLFSNAVIQFNRRIGRL